jgi:hypothetical protein
MLLIYAARAAAQGQASFSDPRSAQSHSGQFVIPAYRALSSSALAPLLATNRDFVRLEPALLTVSSERMKTMFQRELEIQPQWTGKIFLVLRAARSTSDGITITADRFRDKWQYRVDLPDVVERTRFVRAMTQVLLLEYANRKAGMRSAEIPAWVAEGLAQQILSRNDAEIIFPPPQDGGGNLKYSMHLVARELIGNPLADAHTELMTSTPLTFHELSWPPDNFRDGPEARRFAFNAQVLVVELLNLEGGKAAFRSMLSALPEFYNWQFALLRGYSAYFQRPLDVEKWWAVRSAFFTGRDLAQTWPADESWQKIFEIIRPRVQLRSQSTQPTPTQATLQQIIRDWERGDQTQAIQSKLTELQLARLRVSQGLVTIVQGYHQVLQAFLEKRDKSGITALFRKTARQRRLAAETVQRLDGLDAQFLSMQPKPVVSATAPVTPGSAP